MIKMFYNGRQKLTGRQNLTFYFDQPFYLGELVISLDQNQNVD